MKIIDIEKLIRPHFSNLNTYDPVDPPEALASKSGVPKNQIIKLNGNENAYGSSPKVSDALSTLQLHVYPDPLQINARNALSKYIGIASERIIAGAGSDELIDLLFRLFISPGDSVIACSPTFGMYEFLAKVSDARIKLVPRDNSFEIDIGAVTQAIESRSKMIFVSSPNNPTGNTISLDQVKILIDTGLIVVIDEAYYEFCKKTYVGLTANHENLVILRTMSKWAGLAGLRVGYGIMSPKLVNHIIDIKQPYNISTAAEAALISSLEDSEYLLEKVSLITNERNRMFSMLANIKGVKPWPSEGNFILCEFQPGCAANVNKGLEKRGIFVRSFNLDILSDHLRITVGTSEQTDSVVKSIAELV